MTTKKSRTQEMTVRVMDKTQEYLQQCAETMHISVGEVIDRAIVTFATDDPGFAALWTCEQFLFAVGRQSDENMCESVYQLLALLIQSLMRDGMSMEEIMERVQTTLDGLGWGRDR